MDGVIAVVNQDVVLRSELDRRVASFQESLQSVPDLAERSRRRIELTRQVLGAIIDERLFTQEAGRMGLSATDEDVDRAIVQVKSQNNLDDPGLAKALQQGGYTMSQYREEIRHQIMQAKVVNILLRPRIHISEADLQAAYKEVQKKDPKGIGTFKEVRQPLEERLFEDAMFAEQRRWLIERRSSSYIDMRGVQ